MSTSTVNPSSEAEGLTPGNRAEHSRQLTEWFSTEVHAHEGNLKLYLRGKFPAVRDVDDVVQESYLRVWKARVRSPIRCSRAFLFTVARNLAINLLRRERIISADLDRDSDPTSVLDNGPDAIEMLTRQERRELLSDALVALPAKTRAVFILHKLEGLTQAEVARRLNLSEKSVEYQTLRALHLCEAFIQTRGH